MNPTRELHEPWSGQREPAEPIQEDRGVAIALPGRMDETWLPSMQPGHDRPEVAGEPLACPPQMRRQVSPEATRDHIEYLERTRILVAVVTDGPDEPSDIAENPLDHSVSGAEDWLRSGRVRAA